MNIGNENPSILKGSFEINNPSNSISKPIRIAKKRKKEKLINQLQL